MYRKHKIAYAALIMTAATLKFFFNLKLDNFNTALLLNYFSITFGFCVVSLTTLIGSKGTLHFYSRVDPLIKTQRMIHTVKKYYSFTLLNSLCAISLIVVSSLVPNENMLKAPLWVHFTTDTTIISLFFISIVSTWLILKLSLSGLTKEAKNQ